MGNEKHEYKKDYLQSLLKSIKGKTLEEIGGERFFELVRDNPKITGIYGTIIEQCVLNYPPNSSKDPDLIVDDVECELKTTGLRKNEQDGVEKYVPKEPVTITGVSIPTIVKEDFFYYSHFWRKIQNLLFVFYEYKSKTTVSSLGYKDFPVIGHMFLTFSREDTEILRKDWELVRNYLRKSKEGPEPEKMYSLLYPNLCKDLNFLDTSPRYPNPPRFRFKRSFFSTILEKHFHPDKYEVLDDSYTGISDFDHQCHISTERYKGKSFRDLIKIFNIEDHSISKQTSEQFVVKMFEGKSKKINNLEVFNKFSVVGKTITLNPKGGKTEDTKLFTIDFEEIKDPTLEFEDSEFYSYFTQKFLFIIFQEPVKDSPLLDNIFIGFKRYSFSLDFVDTYVRKLWETIRDLVNNGRLKETICCDKDNNPIINETGVFRTKLNFPKSSDKQFLFVRGTGRNSSKKTLILNNIKMYDQQVWVRGLDIVDILSREQFL